MPLAKATHWALCERARSKHPDPERHQEIGPVDPRLWREQIANDMPGLGHRERRRLSLNFLILILHGGPDWMAQAKRLRQFRSVRCNEFFRMV